MAAKKQRLSAPAAVGTSPAQATGAAAGGKLKVPKPIADKVQWINDNVELAVPLRLGAVARSLVELGKDVALELMESLVRNVASVEDPNAWLIDAAAAARDVMAAGEAGGAVGGVEEPEEGEAQEPPALGLPAAAGARAGRATLYGIAPGGPRVTAALHLLRNLDASGKLQECVAFNTFEVYFDLMGALKARKVVDALFARPGRIEAHHLWFEKLCRKQLSDVESLIATICLNENLREPLEPLKVKDTLKDLPDAVALRILRDLEVRAAVIAHPWAWIRNAGRSLRSPADENPAPGAGLPQVGGRALKMIDNLNKRNRLAAPLEVHRVVQALRTVPSNQQSSIMALLQQKKAEVEDPTAFVEAECSKVQCLARFRRDEAEVEDPNAFVMAECRRAGERGKAAPAAGGGRKRKAPAGEDETAGAEAPPVAEAGEALAAEEEGGAVLVEDSDDGLEDGSS